MLDYLLPTFLVLAGQWTLAVILMVVSYAYNLWKAFNYSETVKDPTLCLWCMVYAMLCVPGLPVFWMLWSKYLLTFH